MIERPLLFIILAALATVGVTWLLMIVLRSIA